ncbi:MAG: AEC family transporter [Ileibacterium sp.]|nr:AEC family transporter [Ileibacterium sp.]
MSEALIVAQQVFIMFILMVTGFILTKANMIKEEAVPVLNSLVVYAAGPAIMIQSFLVDFSMEKLLEMGVALILAVGLMVIAIAGGMLFFPKDHIARFSVVFNNCGFIGIPLVQAVLGEGAIFYLTILLAVWNLFSWTYGITLLAQDRSWMSLKKVLTNPATVSVGIGLLFFLTPLKMPQVIQSSLQYIGNMNTPLAMLVLGYSLTHADFGRILHQPRLWVITAVRLLIIPLITMAVFCLVPAQFAEIRTTMMIAAATPTGATLTMFLGMLHKKSSSATLIISLTTLCSMITIPLILALASILWGM